MALLDTFKAQLGTAWHVNSTAFLTTLANAIDTGGDEDWPVAGAAQAAITDGSGGTANATTGVDATLGVQTFIIPVSLAKLANSQAFEIDPGFNGLITGINFRVGDTPVTTGSKAATVTASIAGTNITTGGVVALTSAAATPVGAKIAGSAATAQAFTSSQAIGFNVSSVTTFSEGDGYVEITVINTDLANAIATILAQTNALRAGLVTAGVLKGSA